LLVTLSPLSPFQALLKKRTLAAVDFSAPVWGLFWVLSPLPGYE